MNGLTDLQELLANADPVLGPKEYVFATFPGAHYADLASLSPLASFQEQEGLSLVIERSIAEAAGISSQGIFRKISLSVHSSLETVGLTAAISRQLAERGISANIIAARYHDHIFVPIERAEEALQALQDLR